MLDYEILDLAIDIVIFVIGIATMATGLYLSIHGMHKLDRLEHSAMNRINTSMDQLKYSDQARAYIRQITQETVAIRFREFKDTHDMEKINRTHVRNLIESIAREVKESLNEKNMDYDMMMMTEESVDRYIIDMATTLVKVLLDEFTEEI